MWCHRRGCPPGRAPTSPGRPCPWTRSCPCNCCPGAGSGGGPVRQRLVRLGGRTAAGRRAAPAADGRRTAPGPLRGPAAAAHPGLRGAGTLPARRGRARLGPDRHRRLPALRTRTAGRSGHRRRVGVALRREFGPVALRRRGPHDDLRGRRRTGAPAAPEPGRPPPPTEAPPTDARPDGEDAVRRERTPTDAVGVPRERPGDRPDRSGAHDPTRIVDTRDPGGD